MGVRGPSHSHGDGEIARERNQGELRLASSCTPCMHSVRLFSFRQAHATSAMQVTAYLVYQYIRGQQVQQGAPPAIAQGKGHGGVSTEEEEGPGAGDEEAALLGGGAVASDWECQRQEGTRGDDATGVCRSVRGASREGAASTAHRRSVGMAGGVGEVLQEESSAHRYTGRSGGWGGGGADAWRGDGEGHHTGDGDGWGGGGDGEGQMEMVDLTGSVGGAVERGGRGLG